MNRVKNPLFQWSLTIALLSSGLNSFLLGTASPLAKLSLGMQSLTTFLLLLLPVTGIVLGGLSWKRKEGKAGWAIVVIVLNAVQLLVILLHLFFLSAG